MKIFNIQFVTPKDVGWRVFTFLTTRWLIFCVGLYTIVRWCL